MCFGTGLPVNGRRFPCYRLVELCKVIAHSFKGRPSGERILDVIDKADPDATELGQRDLRQPLKRSPSDRPSKSESREVLENRRDGLSMAIAQAGGNRHCIADPDLGQGQGDLSSARNDGPAGRNIFRVFSMDPFVRGMFRPSAGGRVIQQSRSLQANEIISHRSIINSG